MLYKTHTHTYLYIYIYTYLLFIARSRTDLSGVDGPGDANLRGNPGDPGNPQEEQVLPDGLPLDKDLVVQGTHKI